MWGWLWKNRRGLTSAAFLFAVGFTFCAAFASTPFVRGAVAGFGLAFTIGLFLFAALIGSNSMRFVLGALGEDATEDYFHARPRRQAGWTLVNGILINDGDIDHVAIGPGGVLAIESKWRSAEAISTQWAPQARGQAFMAARTMSNLISQLTGTNVAVTPVLMEWGPGSPKQSAMEQDGVISVSSKDLEPFDAWLEQDRLDHDTATAIGTAVAKYLAAQLETRATS